MIYLYDKTNNKKIPLTSEVSSGCPVGFVGGFAGGVPNDNWLECDGSTFDQYKYPALYTYLGTNVLPDYRNRFLEGVGPNETVGTNKAAGLPNITGSFSPGDEVGRRLNYTTLTGAFGGTTSSAPIMQAVTSSARDSIATPNFDASRSNSIYGNSTTVQPASTLIRWCIKATSAGIDVDTSLYATKGYIRDQNYLADWEDITVSGTTSNTVTAEYDGFMNIVTPATDSGVVTTVTVNGTAVPYSTGYRSSNATNDGIYGLALVKGDEVVITTNAGAIRGISVRYYTKRDYSNRS